MNHNQLALYSSVQEFPATAWGSGANAASTTLFNSWNSGTRLRFTDISLAGSAGFCSTASPASLEVKDCWLHGAKLTISGGYYATLGFTNNIIERCDLSLLSCSGGAYYANFYNNLFLNGNLGLAGACSGSILPNFAVKNNLFVNGSFTYGSGGTPQIANNGYYQTALTSQGTAPKNITILNFQTGPLGNYYYSNDLIISDDLSTLINAGSGTPAQAGLYHHTVKTNANFKEGTDPIQTVDIGFHYVAVNDSGNPIDTDGDGLADYLEDSNGNGSYGTGDVGDYFNTDSDGDGLPDKYELTSTLTSPTAPDTGNTGTSDGYKDPDADGLTNLEEMQLGKNPLVPDVAAPIFSPVGGDYSSAQDVYVTCPTAGATIYYTLDGSEPQNIPAQQLPAPPNNRVTVASSQTLKAKAWKTGWTPSDTESQDYRINDTANNAPTVTVSPSGSVSFLASDSIEFLVEAADSDGTIAKVQLYRRDISGNDYKMAETTSSVLRYSLANVPSGTYTFIARAIDNQGAVTLNPAPPAAPITLTIAASGPVVSLVGAQPFYTSNPGTLLANITGVNPTALTTLTLNGVAIPKRTGEFAINTALVEGPNTFTLLANGTAQASTTVYLDSTAPTIAITAPANNANLSTTRVNVSGTFTESSLKQITVNGVLAFISGNTFTVLNVPLATGANTITATAEDIAGNSTSTTINITGGATLVDPVQFAASTVGGFATLNVTFTPTASVPGTLQQVLYDFTGDNNSLNFQTATDLNPVSHNYTLAGEYFPVVTIVTTAGKFSSLGGWNSTTADRLRINVQAAPLQVGSPITITDPVDLKTTANGHLFVLSRSTRTIKEYDATPSEIRSLTSIGTANAAPTGLDVDGDGNIYVALSGDHQVAKYKLVSGDYVLDTDFNGTGLIGKSDHTSGTGNGEFNTPYDVAVSPDGNEIAVSDSGNHRIQRFNIADNSGSFLGTFGSSGSGVGQFNTPKGLTYDGAGYLYIVDSGNNRVALALSSVVIGTSGSLGTALGQFQGAVNLGVGTRGIYVGETGNSRVQVFDPIKSGHGFSPTPFINRLSLSTQLGLSQPNAVVFIADFLAEKIYIADTGNNRVIKATLPETSSPSDTWASMTTSLLAYNIEGAIPYFTKKAGPEYREAFLSIGVNDLATMIDDIGTISPVVIENESAQFYFEQEIDGVMIAFPINFTKENGAWRILDF